MELLNKKSSKTYRTVEKYHFSIGIILHLAEHFDDSKLFFQLEKQSLETPSRPKRAVSKKVKSPSKPPVDGSKHVAMELYTTEGNYVKSLQYLRTEYMEPLEEKGIISKAESKQIFGNLGELIDLHKKIEQGNFSVFYLKFLISL